MPTQPEGQRSSSTMVLRRFGLLTLAGILVFALTMTFVPILPPWLNYVARSGLLLVLGVL